MMINLFYILLALAGVSLLIFLHELGHYIMAKRVGMRVETFSIGFGKPIISWMRQGVRWQIGCIPFGGYVKIAHAEEGAEGEQDPYTVPDGFFGRPPIDRIKVAIAGPLVNIVFALLLFTLLWFAGGREKSFSQYTPLIGWLDPKSPLFERGVRPGDEISSYNDTPFHAVQDHIYAATINGAGKDMTVTGFYHDYPSAEATPFQHTIKPYSHPRASERGILTAGVLQPANYVIYGKMGSDAQDNPVAADSPMAGSDIAYGDRIFWVDGEVIFSQEQLSNILNDDKVLLTIKRNGETLLKRVPRVRVQELRFNHEFKEELADWQFAAQLNDVNLQTLWALPYDITNEGMVITRLRLIDEEKDPEIFPTTPFSAIESPLQRGDKILAVQGSPIKSAYQILAKIQQREVSIIVERNPALTESIDWRLANTEFDQGIPWKQLDIMARSIGTAAPIGASGPLHLLKPVIPRPRNAFASSPEKQALMAAEQQKVQGEIEGIKDPEKRAQAERLIEGRDKQLLLGLPSVRDRPIAYNPNPLATFSDLFHEIWGTLKALVTGSLSPKWLVGPVGIVQIVKDNSMQGLREGLFWMGAISLNLGILNLLPIPVLDGGSIVLSVVEMVTKRRISPKTLEKIVFPFVLLLAAFFLFLTYNDLWRIITSFK